MMSIKSLKILCLGLLVCCMSVNDVSAIREREVIGTIYDYDSLISTTETWFSCPYTKLLEEQFALYKSMEHVNWISIEKIKGKGNYCIGGEGLENPGLIQKVDLWRQRMKTYMISEELRPYYDSQIKPKNGLDDRYDESRMALLDWLFTTRTRMERCNTGFGAAYKENLAKIRLFGCQEGVTATNAQGYRITPDFPYPINKNGPNCFPLNAEYITKAEKEMCDRNMSLKTGCQRAIEKQSYVDDFYCTSGRQQTTK
ncbi:MAG: hypothetical protein MNSN_01230 [Minisyncoccus archaeiphilus]|nr:MAG: hypothetical protein MNSN_01230 [Candidatus Parcubacteria bacterium]